MSLKSGLSHHDKTDLNLRQQTFGENRNPEPPMTGWWALFFESFKDLILIVLCIAAVISFVVGLLEDPEKGWIDGVAILIAVLLVAIVTATNDYQKELQVPSSTQPSPHTWHVHNLTPPPNSLSLPPISSVH